MAVLLGQLFTLIIICLPGFSTLTKAWLDMFIPPALVVTQMYSPSLAPLMSSTFRCLSVMSITELECIHWYPIGS